MNMRSDRFYIAIGIFVVGAFLLVITGSLFFYTQYLQGKKETYVMLFQGSLNGLDSNSPITYRGVRIGKVSRIELTTTSSQSNVAIPVYVEFFVEKSFVYRGDPIQLLIDKGIVADITSPNILTGTANIELVPAKPKQAPFRVKMFHGTPRFPTDSTVSPAGRTSDVMRALRNTLQDLSDFLKSAEFKGMIKSVKEMANSVGALSTSLDKQAPNTLKSIKEMAGSVNALSMSLDKQVPNALLYFKDGLSEFAKAASSARNLTDYLLRHPESLLRGKS
jgi:ABC-type transporter Mla subunit MlaD